MKESKVKEPKFCYGDSVLDITSNHIYRIGGVSVYPVKGVVEYYLTGEDHSGGYWAREDDLSPAIHSEINPPQTRKFSNGEVCLSKAPDKSIHSDGSDGKYYDRTIPKHILNKWNETGTVSAEDLIFVIFRNDFNFGNSFKSLVRADSFVRGIGKQGNTLEYECNKVVYYSNKIVEQESNR